MHGDQSGGRPAQEAKWRCELFWRSSSLSPQALYSGALSVRSICLWILSRQVSHEGFAAITTYAPVPYKA